MTDETPYAMAKRHVREAEVRIARQELLVRKVADGGNARLVQLGHELLDALQNSLRLSREHLAIEEARQTGHAMVSPAGNRSR